MPPSRLGEAATKEFILTHIFQLGPHLISSNVDLWRELLRLHYRNTPLPTLLADHVQSILEPKPAFEGLPISELFASQATFLRVVQRPGNVFWKPKVSWAQGSPKIATRFAGRPRARSISRSSIRIFGR